MSVFFDAAISRFMENNKGFAVASAETNGTQETCILTNGSQNAKIVYSPDIKRFILLRGDANCSENDYTELQSYLYEPTGEDAADVREAYSVANEFSETFDQAKAVASLWADATALYVKPNEYRSFDQIVSDLKN